MPDLAALTGVMCGASTRHPQRSRRDHAHPGAPVPTAPWRRPGHHTTASTQPPDAPLALSTHTQPPATTRSRHGQNTRAALSSAVPPTKARVRRHPPRGAPAVCRSAWHAGGRGKRPGVRSAAQNAALRPPGVLQHLLGLPAVGELRRNIQVTREVDGWLSRSSRMPARPTTMQAWRWRERRTQRRPVSRWDALASARPLQGVPDKGDSRTRGPEGGARPRRWRTTPSGAKHRSRTWRPQRRARPRRPVWRRSAPRSALIWPGSKPSPRLDTKGSHERMPMTDSYRRSWPSRPRVKLRHDGMRYQAPAWTCAAHTDGRFGYFALSCLTVRWTAADAHNAPDRSAINSP